MTSERLAEIKEKTEAASAGPWRYVSDSHAHKGESPPCADCARTGAVDVVAANGESVPGAWAAYAEDSGLGITQQDAEFIALARTAIPELLEEVKRLRAALTSISGRFRREDDGTLKARDGVAWAMATDAEDALR